MAVFVSPKTDFRSDGDQVEDRGILIYEIKKPLKGRYNPLRGFIGPSFRNPSCSFNSSEG